MHRLGQELETRNSKLVGAALVTNYCLLASACSKPVGGLFKDLVKLTVLYKLVFELFLSVDKLSGYTRVFAMAIHNLTHNQKSIYSSVNGLVLPIIHRTYKNNNEIIKLNYLLFIRSCAK